MLAPSVALIWFRFYNSFHRWNMVYRNHLVLILGHRLFSEVIQYFRCTLGCLDISSDIQCAVFKEQCLRSSFFLVKNSLHLWLTEQSSGKKNFKVFFLSHRCSLSLTLRVFLALHHIYFIIRQPPILPYRYQYSIVGRLGLNRRVRDGNGCVP